MLHLLDGSDALKFDSDWRWQAVDFYCGAAGLVILKVLGINAVVSSKISFHVCQENGNIYQLIPARTGIF